MFKKLFGKGKEVQKDIAIYAPLTGEYVKIEDIPDPVFAQKWWAKVLVLIQLKEKLCLQLQDVDNVFPTKHAIGLKADNGLELLVHIGLDTVQLDGEGFEVLVSSGDEVNVGDPLVRFNLEFINNNAKSVISPIIITNTDQAASINIYDENAVIKGETKVIDVTMN